MPKKVVIAAAGEGTRMLHLTKYKSKHLIEVRKRPFLSYLLDNLFRAGFRDLILVVGYKEELIREFLEKYDPPLKSLRKSQYNITMVSQYDILGPKSKIYGTACPLMCVKDVIGKNHFVYLNGDNLYSVRDLKAMDKKGEYSYIAGLRHKDSNKYGVLIIDNGFLKKIVEKPKKHIGNWVNAGLYMFTSDIFNKIDRISKSSRGEYEITDAINLLAREKKVKIQEIKDFWLDFGNPADIIKISYFLQSLKKFKKFFWGPGFKVISFRARDAAEQAVKSLEKGQVVVSPTDTVYGLLADASNKNAVERVFKIKERDKGKPIPIFVKDIKMAKKLALIDKKQEHFLKEVWPGKITVVLKRKTNNGLPDVLFGRRKTIALRIPDYKLVNDMLKKINKPLTGTSANISGRGSLVKIKEILEEFEHKNAKPDLVLDAGNLLEKHPSSIIDLSKNKPKTLRR